MSTLAHPESPPNARPERDSASSSLNPPGYVVLDACVLMSGIIRPLLLRLAHAGCFRPVWNRRIGLEWRRNAARVWAVVPSVLEDEWNRLQFAFPQADQGDTVEWEAGLRYSDPKDWHVIAAGRAAVARGDGAGAQVLTWNLKDFERSELKRLGLSVLDPDRLLADWWDRHREALQCALREMPADARALGRREDLHDILGRERLYRLRGLVLGNALAT